jgi:hypothetical protein
MHSLEIESIPYDVFNHFTINSKLAPWTSSEHDLLVEQLDEVSEETNAQRNLLQ